MYVFGLLWSHFVLHCFQGKEIAKLKKKIGNYKDATIKESQKIQIFNKMMQLYYVSLTILHLSWHQYFKWTRGLGNDNSFVCGCTAFDYMSLGSRISCAHQCFQPCCGNNLGT
jgi:hypothetical protein